MARELERARYEPHLDRTYEDAVARRADLFQQEQIASGYSSRERFLTELTLDPPGAGSGKTDTLAQRLAPPQLPPHPFALFEQRPHRAPQFRSTASHQAPPPLPRRDPHMSNRRTRTSARRTQRRAFFWRQ
jgi:hypothetical protein